MRVASDTLSAHIALHGNLMAGEGLAAMNWHVQYREGVKSHSAKFQDPDQAIEAACHLLDHGSDVYRIGTRPKSEAMDREQIARIYANWVRARYH
jgi:hypothetical protein